METLAASPQLAGVEEEAVVVVVAVEEAVEGVEEEAEAVEVVAGMRCGAGQLPQLPPRPKPPLPRRLLPRPEPLRWLPPKRMWLLRCRRQP